MSASWQFFFMIQYNLAEICRLNWKIDRGIFINYKNEKDSCYFGKHQG